MDAAGKGAWPGAQEVMSIGESSNIAPAVRAIVDNLGEERRPGAVLICDALGFKGLWKGHYVELLESLKHVQGEADRVLKGFADEMDWTAKSQFFTFSDTLAGTVRVEAKESVTDVPPATLHWVAVEYAAAVASMIQHAALKSKIRLSYRGSIAFGEFMSDDAERILIGEAIDEAAAHHEQAEGAFVRLTPSARTIVDAYCALDGVGGATTTVGEPKLAFLVRREVPVKQLGMMDSWVVNPLVPGANWELDAREFTSRMRATFDRAGADPKVEKMWQNTRRFLESLDRDDSVHHDK